MPSDLSVKSVYIPQCCVQYLLLKALPPVCMKYTAQGESRVANVVWSKIKYYICHKTLTKSCILLYKQSSSGLSVLLCIFAYCKSVDKMCFADSKVLRLYISFQCSLHSVDTIQYPNKLNGWWSVILLLYIFWWFEAVNIVCIVSQLPNKSINSLVKHYYTQWKRSYLQVSLLDLRAQERQKKEPNQPR